jgi:hypothetical protein
LSAGFSGKSKSFNNEYVLLPIKLSRVGTWWLSSTSFAAKKCCTRSTYVSQLSWVSSKTSIFPIVVISGLITIPSSSPLSCI